MAWEDVVQAARRGEGPLRFARPAWRAMLRARLPMVRPFWGFIYAARMVRSQRLWPLVAKVFYREPLMRYRCARFGRGVHIEGAIPLIYGNGRIEIGDESVIGGRNTWLVGSKHTEGELIIGDRVAVGYQNTITAAVSVRIGDDTMLAANVQIYDTPTHPLSPARRARHEQPTREECAPVVIGRNVWIGSNAIIMKGVTIGDGAIVAAASVVTRPVPPNTLVAGNPAAVKKELVD